MIGATPMLLVFRPSGAGKSILGTALQFSDGLIHIEVDGAGSDPNCADVGEKDATSCSWRSRPKAANIGHCIAGASI
jgi:hypothetical protein